MEANEMRSRAEARDRVRRAAEAELEQVRAELANMLNTVNTPVLTDNAPAWQNDIDVNDVVKLKGNTEKQ